MDARSIFMALPLALCGCGGDAGKSATAAEVDPAIAGAVGDPIMVDPDLTAQSEAGAAVSGMYGWAVDIPPPDRSPETLAAARAEAKRLAGGRIEPLAFTDDDGPAIARPVTAAQAGQALDARCAARVDYSAIWAARLPPALPVYPRGAVQEAAGTDEAGCRLRVVNFQTPAPPEEVVAFYAALVRKAGMTFRHRRSEGAILLSGGKAGSAFAVTARNLDPELSEVDLVVSGA